MEYVFIFIAAVFVNNIVLAQFLGICPFLGVSKSVPTALGMTGAVTFVMILATLVTFIVQKTVLDPFGIGFMQTIVFILIIAALVQSFPTLDHDELCRAWCGHHGDSKRL